MRRKAGRRASDRIYPIVDIYSARVMAAGLGIMALCCCDALLTLRLLAHGATEANPVMALAMGVSMGWFSTLKFLLTALGVMVLTACSAMRLFQRVPGTSLLYGLLGCYVLLVGYETWLFWRLGLR